MDSFAWTSIPRSAGLAGSSAVPDERGGGSLLPPMLGFQLPPAAAALEHFALDSGLVDRAVRSSCFGAGNGAATAAPAFGHNNAEPELGDDAPGAGDSSSGGSADSKKRKRSEEGGVLGADQDQAKASSNMSSGSANGSERIKGKDNADGPAAAAAASGKKQGKGVKEADELDHEGYVHVRARKGQATNRHSLAERLRREKISERMKLLQDLVPSCSKVTGKAVMLDEIINYVQSLQRQVEFLSMKLATVCPTLNLNIEGLMSKNRFACFPGAHSSAPIGLSFSQDIHKPHLLSQSGMLQGDVHGMGNADMLGTAIQEELNERALFKDPASQMNHTLDGSFHDVTQMAYRSVIGSDDLRIRAHQDGFHM
ncbi:hypothetical protein ACP4OV_017869 [Aristida adscensionis]